MRVLGVVGWSGSGKTALVIRLLPELTRRGLTVSTVKHAHHAFDVDKPGKDSYEHRQAGAHEVMVSSANRWALMHEHRGRPEASLPELLARLSPVDLVLVEGFKRHPHPKLEVWRRAVGQPLLAAIDPHVIAVASDTPVDGLAVPRLDLNDAGAIAEFIVRHEAPKSRVA
jgi:molybdopterin-guanine dinucleotide biosynthesis protein B